MFISVTVYSSTTFLSPKITLNLTPPPRLIFVILKFSKLFCQKNGGIRCNSITKDRFVKFIGPVCTINSHWCCTMETNVDISYNGTN